MRFPILWYRRPAKAQTSLRIRAVLSEHLLVSYIFYGYLATDRTSYLEFLSYYIDDICICSQYNEVSSKAVKSRGQDLWEGRTNRRLYAFPSESLKMLKKIKIILNFLDN